MACLFIMIVMGIELVGALSINEVEQNPAGQDTGNEWIELYSSEEFNLDGFYLQADDNVWNLSGSFSGYLVVQFDRQFLDNADERAFLKDSSGTIIDETPAFDDNANDGKTWQKCENEWVFRNSTRELENDCGAQSLGNNQQGSQQNNQGNNQQSNIEEDNGENAPEQDLTLTNIVQQDNTVSNNLVLANSEQPKKIVLNSVEEKDEVFVTKKEKVRRGVLYSFIGFLVILVVLLAWRKL